MNPYIDYFKDPVFLIFFFIFLFLFFFFAPLTPIVSRWEAEYLINCYLEASTFIDILLRMLLLLACIT